MDSTLVVSMVLFHIVIFVFIWLNPTARVDLKVYVWERLESENGIVVLLQTRNLKLLFFHMADSPPDMYIRDARGVV